MRHLARRLTRFAGALAAIAGLSALVRFPALIQHAKAIGITALITVIVLAVLVRMLQRSRADYRIAREEWVRAMAEAKRREEPIPAKPTSRLHDQLATTRMRTWRFALPVLVLRATYDFLPCGYFLLGVFTTMGVAYLVWLARLTSWKTRAWGLAAGGAAIAVLVIPTKDTGAVLAGALTTVAIAEARNRWANWQPEPEPEPEPVAIPQIPQDRWHDVFGHPAGLMAGSVMLDVQPIIRPPDPQQDAEHEKETAGAQ